ncbi:MAG: galactokinase [Chloroflexota bacterium]
MGQKPTLIEAFARQFGGAPDIVVRAPGRVNLIGEHTDYNDGFVLPMAIDYDVRIAARARPDRTVRLYSATFDQGDVFSLDQVQPSADLQWANYVRGVADVLQREGYALSGLDAAIVGDVPLGAGLSSSAALELASFTALRVLNGLDFDPVRAALLCQRAENEFVGVRCGIMDQFVSSLGQAGYALLIDCRSLEHRLVPLPGEVSVVVVDSGVRRGLVDSAYNERRAQCEEGARRLGVPALRDITVDDLAARLGELPPVVARRCQHVVAENQRALESVAALQRNDPVALGGLMNASHASLRDLFEVSTPDIDTLVEIQQNAPGCLGARLTGAGFGGCTVALVQSEAVDEFKQVVGAAYPACTGKTPHIYVCRAADGAGLV